MSSLRGRLILGILAGTSVFLLLAGIGVYSVVRARMLGDLEQSLDAVWSTTVSTLHREFADGEIGRVSLHDEFPLVGVSFAPWAEDQDPDLGAQVDVPQLRERLGWIADDAAAIRTFTVGSGLDAAGGVIQGLGRTAAIGAWIGPDRAANALEIDRLVERAQAGEVDLAIVGSDVLARGDLPEPELLDLLRAVRERLPEHVPLTTAANWEVWFQNASLVGTVDLLLVGYRPFDAGIEVDAALQALACWHHEVLGLAQGRPVIAEVGWPTGGEAVLDAVPSPENAARFLDDFRLWATRNDVPYFWDAAIDEAWKRTLGEPHAAHVGYRTSDGALKPALAPALAGPRARTGSARLILDEVPEMTGEERLRGRVEGVGALNHRVATYLRVDGVWWPKPSFAEPLTTIDCSGSWAVDLSTYPDDIWASEFAVFVVRADAELPYVGGSTSLPAELFALAAAHAEHTW